MWALASAVSALRRLDDSMGTFVMWLSDSARQWVSVYIKENSLK